MFKKNKLSETDKLVFHEVFIIFQIDLILLWKGYDRK